MSQDFKTGLNTNFVVKVCVLKMSSLTKIENFTLLLCLNFDFPLFNENIM